MAIVTTTSRANVVARLDKQPGSGWPAPFAAVVCGAEVARKRPDLQADPCALDALRPRRADTLAIEDAPAGVAAASAAGVPVVVTHSRRFRAGPISPAVAVGPSLGHAQGWLAARAGSAGRTDFSQLRNRHSAARLRL